MMKNQSKTAFVDLKFFIGLIFAIYGILLIATGSYYVFNKISELDPVIDIYWGLLMFAVGIVSYYKSVKPDKWSSALATPGIERIERRLKREFGEIKRELE